ncbi:hypothetical protein [Aeribacillus composti]|uniref:hypothetical protein n=1 Tax=Aeribacillus composti TaxID=1868734 RepID=UPI002E1BB0B4|nr:hypothetical protein [Aeribacillus composti]
MHKLCPFINMQEKSGQSVSYWLIRSVLQERLDEDSLGIRSLEEIKQAFLVILHND